MVARTGTATTSTPAPGSSARSAAVIWSGLLCRGSFRDDGRQSLRSEQTIEEGNIALRQLSPTRQSSRELVTVDHADLPHLVRGRVVRSARVPSEAGDLRPELPGPAGLQPRPHCRPKNRPAHAPYPTGCGSSHRLSSRSKSPSQIRRYWSFRGLLSQH